MLVKKTPPESRVPRSCLLAMDLGMDVVERAAPQCS
jgi:hypothetical protein